mgnify:CR=1 FL=1
MCRRISQDHCNLILASQLRGRIEEQARTKSPDLTPAPGGFGSVRGVERQHHHGPCQ